MEYVLYTDGAYSMKNNEGAFAYIILDENGKIVKKSAHKIQNETNNRAELKAIIAGIYNVPFRFDEVVNVVVLSDSQYALNTLFGGWSRNSNKDLFDVFEKIKRGRKLEFEWHWVKGHSGELFNEMCDKMCIEVLGYDPSIEYAKFKKKK